MSESARKKQRVSPRISGDATDHSSTLYNDLHRLASIAPKPVTPFRRAASAGITPRSATIRTPGTARTPRGGPATRPLPARRAAPTTPHAIRALRERANAARTPGHVRRRSGRVQRETPRDLLRNLSRVLARNTQPIEPTPKAQQRNRHSALDLPDIEDDEPTAPRLSMPLDDMYDDDSFNEEPPRPSLLAPLPDYDYDNGTVQSVEFGRRARSEDPRLDRLFGRRISEQFGDLHDLTINGEEYELDGNFINRRGTLLPNELLEQVEEEFEEGNTEAEIRALTGRARASDTGDLGVFGEVEGEEEEPTFRFEIRPRIEKPGEDEESGEEEEHGDGEVDDNTPGELEETMLEDDDEQPALNLVYDNDDTAPVLASDNENGPLEIAGWESEPENLDDEDLAAYRGEVSAIDRSLQTPAPETPAKRRAGRQRRALNISRFGHEYPSFPAATVKMLANGFVKGQGSKSKISKDTLEALVQTSDFFFEQVGEDLAAYAGHAGRKMIEESDVIALLKRTRQVTDSSTYFFLAQKLLPRELLQQLRMQPLPKLKRQKRKRMEAIPEEDGDDE
ncbi:hypothetical protein DPSP01_005578 [Paraphaeosphaeria sporulosa]|uniref:CENP-T/Histone H4 histone fold domain-containing protein n=1 Tax=Paraphaeosphaeria sporulosa TaxID=1460663 RepID=A0A177CTL4_9PLEO|nr:uncharacterized protein CC84DRAFT_1161458 [Paraphaeosphaeria sporulosa]OAG10531.1 hypothetical protein CC84DRAFT_1161458 [Paraphaeosphaeria sporulosa]